MLSIDLVFASIEPFFEWYRQKETAIWLCGILLLTLIVAVSWFLLVTIGRRRASIGGLNRDLGRLEDRQAFVQQFERINTRFRRGRFLRHAWLEFDKVLLKPEDGSGLPIRLTVRPSDYFSREMCGMTFPIWHALSNYFVGIGLLLTFVGLVAGLYFASSTVGGTDVAATQTGLKQLLDAATVKFLTSICGLAASIIFSIVYHLGLKSLDRGLERLCEQIERLTDFATPERIADQQLAELQHQRAVIERLGTDLGMEISKGLGETLDAALARRLQESMGPLTHAVQDLSHNLGQQNTDALERLANDFRRSLQQAAGSEMEDVRRSLADAAARLDDVAGHLDATFSQAGNAFSESAQRGVDAITGRLEAAAEALHGDLANSGVQLAEVGRQLNAGLVDAGSTLGKQADEAASRLAHSLDEAGQRLARALAPFDRLRASLEGLDEQLEHQARNIQTAGEETTTAARAMRGVASTADNAFRGLTAIIAPLQGRAVQFYDLGRP